MNRSCPARALLLASMLALAACSTAPASRNAVPTAERSGQGWVVTRTPVAARLLQSCPPGIAEDAQDLYAPGRGVIEQLENRLPDLPPAIGPLESDRQYVGVVLQDRTLVYVRGLPARDHRLQDPGRELVSDCDSGWETLFDPASGNFDRLRRFPAASGH